MKEEKIDIFSTAQVDSTSPVENKKTQGGKYKGKTYFEDYTIFMETLEQGFLTGTEVGEMVARMAQHFAKENMLLGRSLKIYNLKARDMYSGVEENGKPISAAKAEILTNATPEAAAYHEARINVQNIEQIINALKALQRGILKEETQQY